MLGLFLRAGMLGSFCGGDSKETLRCRTFPIYFIWIFYSLTSIWALACANGHNIQKRKLAIISTFFSSCLLLSSQCIAFHPLRRSQIFYMTLCQLEGICKKISNTNFAVAYGCFSYFLQPMFGQPPRPTLVPAVYS